MHKDWLGVIPGRKVLSRKVCVDLYSRIVSDEMCVHNKH